MNKTSKLKAGQLKPNQAFIFRGRKCKRLDRKGIVCLADEDRDRLDRKFTLSFHDEVDAVDKEQSFFDWKELNTDQKKQVKAFLNESNKFLARKGMKYKIKDGSFKNEYINPYAITESLIIQ